jgi:hypothetical protein
MSTNIRISVIMGIYNCASTITEALDSLLAQTYQDFKVIMCDDGSSDNTIEIAQSYVNRYPGKFFLIKNEQNLKLAATLNHCLEYADTEYIARMDGDDLCSTDRFEKQVNFLDENRQYSHVSSSMKLFDEDGFYGLMKVHDCEPGNNAFKNGTPYFHAPTIFRRDALETVGYYTAAPRVERVEDYYLWYKFHRAGLQGYNLSEPLYYMRNDKNAFSRRKFRDRVRSFKVKIEVLNGLKIKGGIIYALRDLSKGLVPSFLIRQIIKHRY